MSADWIAATEPWDAEDEDDPQSQELVDDADEFEEQLAAEMLRTGAIEVWI